MKRLCDITSTPPAIVPNRTGYKLSWGLALEVDLHRTGEVGQFASSGGWKRAEVEAAVTPWITGDMISTDTNVVSLR